MLTSFKNPAVQGVLLGQARHLLTAAATYLVTTGYLEATNVETFVGIVMYAGVALWSAVAKKG